MYQKLTNIVGFEELARSLAQQLHLSGMSIVNIDTVQDSSYPLPATAKRIVLQASTSVDAKSSSEPWSIVVEGNDLKKTFSVNVVPSQQVTSTGSVSKAGKDIESGRLSIDSDTNNFFAGLEQWGIPADADYAAVPFTLYYCSTDHGIAFHVSVNAMDNSGTAFSWAVIQRPVDESSMQVPAVSPLFAVYRTKGTGNPDVLEPTEVQRITVREQDVPAAALPVTACAFAPDVIPIINMMQQVSVLPDNNAVISFPQMINTQRHVHKLMLDMLGYISADIMSAGSEVPVKFSAVAERKYLALNANGQNNRGVRILFPMY